MPWQLCCTNFKYLKWVNGRKMMMTCAVFFSIFCFRLYVTEKSSWMQINIKTWSMTKNQVNKIDIILEAGVKLTSNPARVTEAYKKVLRTPAHKGKEVIQVLPHPGLWQIIWWFPFQFVAPTQYTDWKYISLAATHDFVCVEFVYRVNRFFLPLWEVFPKIFT